MGGCMGTSGTVCWLGRQVFAGGEYRRQMHLIDRVAPIANRLAPTGFSVGHKKCVRRQSTVGASLLAMRPVQPTNNLKDQPRANSTAFLNCSSVGRTPVYRTNCSSAWIAITSNPVMTR